MLWHVQGCCSLECPVGKTQTIQQRGCWADCTHRLWVRRLESKGSQFSLWSTFQLFISLRKLKLYRVLYHSIALIWYSLEQESGTEFVILLAVFQHRANFILWMHIHTAPVKGRPSLNSFLAVPIDWLCYCLAKGLTSGCLSNDQGKKGLLSFSDNSWKNGWMTLVLPVGFLSPPLYQAPSVHTGTHLRCHQSNGLAASGPSFPGLCLHQEPAEHAWMKNDQCPWVTPLIPMLWFRTFWIWSCPHGMVLCILLNLMATNDWSSWNSQTCSTLQPSVFCASNLHSNIMNIAEKKVWFCFFRQWGDVGYDS